MTRPHPTAALFGLLIASVLLVACGDDADEPVQVGDGGDVPTDLPADQVVASVEVVGAFTTPELSFQNLPTAVVYGDGTLVTPAPQIAIYPGPALPALQSADLSDADLADIVEAARDAGLDRAGVDYGRPPVADAGDTVVTVTIDGTTYEHRATALGLVAGPGGGDAVDGLTDEQVADRQTLAAFVERLSQVPSGATSSIVEPDRYRLWVRPASEVDTGPVDEDNLEPRSVPWTVTDVTLTASGCIPVEGAAAADVAALLADADTLTRFDDGATTWAVVARPVLRHEPTCPDA